MTKIKPGEVLHFLKAITYHQDDRGVFLSLISKRGDEITVTPELLEANTDRFGNLPPSLLEADDPEAQIRRWGQQLVGVGPWPDDLLTSVPGTPEHKDARRRAVRTAYSIPDGRERQAALGQIEEKFGPAQPSNTSTKYGAAR